MQDRPYFCRPLPLGIEEIIVTTITFKRELLKADEHGNEILQTKVGGRTTYYTETQKVFQ